MRVMTERAFLVLQMLFYLRNGLVDVTLGAQLL